MGSDKGMCRLDRQGNVQSTRQQLVASIETALGGVNGGANKLCDARLPLSACTQSMHVYQRQRMVVKRAVYSILLCFLARALGGLGTDPVAS